ARPPGLDVGPALPGDVPGRPSHRTPRASMRWDELLGANTCMASLRRGFLTQKLAFGRAFTRQGVVLMAPDLESRVSVLETQMASVQEDLAEIKQQIGQAATKRDLQDLQQFFDNRDKTYTHNLWRLVFGLVLLV